MGRVRLQCLAVLTGCSRAIVIIHYRRERIWERSPEGFYELDNILFWHRNLERGKGFFLNGYNDKKHYPDFIVYTQKGNLILLETKGDHLDNQDSRDKNILGKTWAEKAGDNFKYFMVFQTKEVKNAYTAKGIIDVIKRL